MCGIAGILSLTDSDPVAEAPLRRMLTMLRHRGPDEFGIYLGDGIGLGHARLSILDLSGGQQPIANEDETLWIVFNGEVFNHLELRADLEGHGHRFRTRSDTEVILHLYEQYGPECLARMNGQWAIAIWDERKRSLFLARDRVGVRPLFYTQAANTLLFGSEIKAILAHPLAKAEWDPTALDQVFTYWSTLSPRSCFRGIVDLPPGHYLLVQDGHIKVAPYWQIQFPSTDQEDEARRRPTQQYVEELRQLLIDATLVRLRADVPVGAYLSGGLDSSVTAAIVRKFGPSHLDTFSIAFSDPEFDESEWQLRMARFLGTEHQVVHAAHAEIGEVFPEVVWHAETPILRTAPAPMFLLSKLVRDREYKVVLTGEGADEFLAGYDIFKEAKVRRFWARKPESTWRPLLLKRLYPDIGDLASTGGSYLKAFFGAGLGDVNAPDYSHAVRWRNNRRISRFFSEELKSAITRNCGASDGGLVLPPTFHGWGPLQRAQYLEISIFLSQYLLSSQGDRMGMAHSVEGRFPFLDHRVIEFCNRLPARLKLRGLTEKFLLREVARPWLPPEIWSRGKRPYRAPIQRSFFNPACEGWVRELLAPGAVSQVGLFKPAAVAQLVDKADRGTPLSETDNMALVGVISTQLVHQQFVSHIRPAPPLPDTDDLKVVRRGAGCRDAQIASVP